jgi:hypothetical protein
MSNKNKTVSFRISEDKFEGLSDIADREDISLSQVFRNYVDKLITHDGQVQVAPEHHVESKTDNSFPPRVEVPKTFLREHERLELKAEHLREQLDEYKKHVTTLEQQLEEQETTEENIVRLKDIDATVPKEDDEEHVVLE